MTKKAPIIDEVEAPEAEAPVEAPVEGLTTNEIAAKFGTDTKTLRRFLRSELDTDSLPGKGNRYRIPEAKLEELQRRFNDKGARRVTEVKFKDEAEEPTED